MRILKASELRTLEPSVSTAAGVHQQHKNDSVELTAIEQYSGQEPSWGQKKD